MKALLVPPALWLIAQTTPAPDLSPLAYWGVAGTLLTFILWLYLDERREHKALREKMLVDVLPALIANNEQMHESTAAMERMTMTAHQIAGRPNLDPVLFAEWLSTLKDVRELLDKARIEREIQDRRHP